MIPSPSNRWILGMGLALASLTAGGWGPCPNPDESYPRKQKWASPTWLNDSFLDAVKQVESHGDNNAVSSKGASGPYQFMEATWKEHAKGKPFSEATNEPVARQVCKDYYLWIYRTASNYQSKEATMEQCLAAYNGGLTRLRRNDWNIHKMPTETIHYVEKVKYDMHRTQSKESTR